MAKRTVVTITDDLDGSVAAETVTFSLDGTSYEIDLSDANAKKLRELFGVYVPKARLAESAPVRRRGRPGRPATVSSTERARSREESADIRTWAKASGKPVSERGRIAANLVDEWKAAGSPRASHSIPQQRSAPTPPVPVVDQPPAESKPTAVKPDVVDQEETDPRPPAVAPAVFQEAPTSPEPEPDKPKKEPRKRAARKTQPVAAE